MIPRIDRGLHGARTARRGLPIPRAPLPRCGASLPCRAMTAPHGLSRARAQSGLRARYVKENARPTRAPARCITAARPTLRTETLRRRRNARDALRRTRRCDTGEGPRRRFLRETSTRRRMLRADKLLRRCEPARLDDPLHRRRRDRGLELSLEDDSRSRGHRRETSLERLRRRGDAKRSGRRRSRYRLD